jgi:hypothetical protein
MRLAHLCSRTIYIGAVLAGLGVSCKPVAAQGLSKYDIIPLGGSYFANGIKPWEFKAMKIDRVNNKLLLCAAAIVSQNGTLVLNAGACQSLGPFIGNVATSTFAGESHYSGPSNVPPTSFWSIDSTKGGVIFCAVLALPNQTCVQVLDR